MLGRPYFPKALRVSRDGTKKALSAAAVAVASEMPVRVRGPTSNPTPSPQTAQPAIQPKAAEKKHYRPSPWKLEVSQHYALAYVERGKALDTLDTLRQPPEGRRILESLHH